MKLIKLNEMKLDGIDNVLDKQDNSDVLTVEERLKKLEHNYEILSLAYQVLEKEWADFYHIVKSKTGISQ